MNDYIVSYQMKNIVHNSSPSDPDEFGISARDKYSAAKKAVPELIKIGFRPRYYDTWNASIIDPKDKENSYQILCQGNWLINFKTGKPKKTLEDRI